MMRLAGIGRERKCIQIIDWRHLKEKDHLKYPDAFN
jgi:hypothetical protein